MKMSTFLMKACYIDPSLWMTYVTISWR